MKKNTTLAITVLIITAIVGIIHYIPSSKVRFFCSNDRVFIEFEEYGKVWGTLWLDDSGLPVSCSANNKVKSSGKSNII